MHDGAAAEMRVRQKVFAVSTCVEVAIMKSVARVLLVVPIATEHARPSCHEHSFLTVPHLAAQVINVTHPAFGFSWLKKHFGKLAKH